MTTTPNSIRFVLPQLPPSINGLYIPEVRNGRFIKMRLSDEARQWKSRSSQYVPRFEIPESSLLKIDFLFCYRFHYKNGELRNFDSQNLMKAAIDCICERLGIRDKRAKAGSWDSVDDANERVECVLTELVVT